MARRIRQHVNPLKATALIPRAPLALPLTDWIEVELGCGDGLFLVQRAQASREHFFLGLDIRGQAMAPGQRQASERGLHNVRLEEANFIVDLEHLFAPQQVTRFWVNFPDPWFKTRTHNRRWFDAKAVAVLAEALVPGGLIVYQSDVWSPALEALGVLESQPHLRNVEGSFSFSRRRWSDEKTSREQACEREGREIWRVVFTRD